MVRPRLLKTLSLLIVCTLLAQDLLYANPDIRLSVPTLPPQLASLKIPASIGRVEEIHYLPDSKKTVYLIQDAHVNESAQRNIARILEKLLQKEAIRYVFLEAGTGDDSLSSLRALAPLKKRVEVADKFLRKGQFQGPDYLDLTSALPFQLWGVEEKSLYEEGLGLYRDLLKKQAFARAYLDQVRRAVETLKVLFYSPSLRAIDAARSAYLKNELPFTEYVSKLLVASERLGLEQNPFYHLDRFQKIQKMESTIDFEKAQAQQARALAELAPEEQRELKRLLERAEPGKWKKETAVQEKAFHASLEEKLKDASRFPDLSRYFSYVREIEKLESGSLLLEIQDLESQVFGALTRSNDEKRLYEIAVAEEVLRRLVELRATPSDLESLRIKPARFEQVELAGYLNGRLMALESHYEAAIFLNKDFDRVFESAKRFYALSEKRDQRFIQNISQKMRSEGLEKAVFIAGGFHASNLKRLFQENRVSYVSIIPQVRQETNIKKYEKILLGDGRRKMEEGRWKKEEMWNTLPAAEMPGVRNALQIELTARGTRLSKKYPLILYDDEHEKVAAFEDFSQESKHILTGVARAVGLLKTLAEEAGQGAYANLLERTVKRFLEKDQIKIDSVRVLRDAALDQTRQLLMSHEALKVRAAEVAVETGLISAHPYLLLVVWSHQELLRLTARGRKIDERYKRLGQFYRKVLWPVTDGLLEVIGDDLLTLWVRDRWTSAQGARLVARQTALAEAKIQELVDEIFYPRRYPLTHPDDLILALFDEEIVPSQEAFNRAVGILSSRWHEIEHAFFYNRRSQSRFHEFHFTLTDRALNGDDESQSPSLDQLKENYSRLLGLPDPRTVLFSALMSISEHLLVSPEHDTEPGDFGEFEHVDVRMLLMGAPLYISYLLADGENLPRIRQVSEEYIPQGLTDSQFQRVNYLHGLARTYYQIVYFDDILERFQGKRYHPQLMESLKGLRHPRTKEPIDPAKVAALLDELKSISWSLYGLNLPWESWRQADEERNYLDALTRDSRELREAAKGSRLSAAHRSGLPEFDSATNLWLRQGPLVIHGSIDERDIQETNRLLMRSRGVMQEKGNFEDIMQGIFPAPLRHFSKVDSLMEKLTGVKRRYFFLWLPEMPEGSFKPYVSADALYHFERMSVEDRLRLLRIVAESTGNQGRAVAMLVQKIKRMYPGHADPLHAVIFVPYDANPEKLEKMRRLGAVVVRHDLDAEDLDVYIRAHDPQKFDPETIRQIEKRNESRKLKDYTAASLRVEKDLEDNPDSVFYVRHGGQQGIAGYANIGLEALDQWLRGQADEFLGSKRPVVSSADFFPFTDDLTKRSERSQLSRLAFVSPVGSGGLVSGLAQLFRWGPTLKIFGVSAVGVAPLMDQVRRGGYMDKITHPYAFDPTALAHVDGIAATPEKLTVQIISQMLTGLAQVPYQYNDLMTYLLWGIFDRMNLHIEPASVLPLTFLLFYGNHTLSDSTDVIIPVTGSTTDPRVIQEIGEFSRQEGSKDKIIQTLSSIAGSRLSSPSSWLPGVKAAVSGLVILAAGAVMYGVLWLADIQSPWASAVFNVSIFALLAPVADALGQWISSDKPIVKSQAIWMAPVGALQGLASLAFFSLLNAAIPREGQPYGFLPWNEARWFWVGLPRTGLQIFVLGWIRIHILAKAQTWVRHRFLAQNGHQIPSAADYLKEIYAMNDKKKEAYYTSRALGYLKAYAVQWWSAPAYQMLVEGISNQPFRLWDNWALNKKGFMVQSKKLRNSRLFLFVSPVLYLAAEVATVILRLFGKDIPVWRRLVDPARGVTLVLQLGGTRIRTGWQAPDSEELNILPVTATPEKNRGSEELLRVLVREIESARVASGYAPEQVGDIVIASPGILREDGFVKVAYNVALTGVELADELSTRLKNQWGFTVPVRVLNDLHSEVLGEIDHLPTTGDALYVNLGTGLSGAWVHQGKMASLNLGGLLVNGQTFEAQYQRLRDEIRQGKRRSEELAAFLAEPLRGVADYFGVRHVTLGGGVARELGALVESLGAVLPDTRLSEVPEDERGLRGARRYAAGGSIDISATYPKDAGRLLAMMDGFEDDLFQWALAPVWSEVELEEKMTRWEKWTLEHDRRLQALIVEDAVFKHLSWRLASVTDHASLLLSKRTQDPAHRERVTRLQNTVRNRAPWVTGSRLTEDKKAEFAELFRDIDRFSRELSQDRNEILLDRAMDLKRGWANIHRKPSILSYAYAIALFAETAERIVRDSHAGGPYSIDPSIASYIGGRPNDKQVEAAIRLLNNRTVVGMLPSEGKTLAVTLATYLKALSGAQVEVHGWNTHLSARDAQVAGAILDRLGMKAALITDSQAYWFDPQRHRVRSTAFRHLRRIDPVKVLKDRNTVMRTRKSAFKHADVVYGPYDEMIFLWMRDWFALDEESIHSASMPDWVIVEEADTPFVDMAAEPLAISHKTQEGHDPRIPIYSLIYRYALGLNERTDYHVFGERVWMDTAQAQKVITDLTEMLNVYTGFMYLRNERELVGLVGAAVEASRFYRRDEDYFTEGDRVVIRDGNTGEVKKNKRWSRSLHTFLEIKEKVTVRADSVVSGALITPAFYKYIPNFSAVMGVLNGEMREGLDRLYEMTIQMLEPAYPSNRRDLPDRYFRTEKEKHNHLKELIRLIHPTGRPILINARTPSEAKALRDLILAEDSKNKFLNERVKMNVIDGRRAVADEMASQRIGDAFAITISAQIASRGLEIKLDEELFGAVDTPMLGPVAGLVVLSTHRAASETLEEQVRARAARRGKPGLTLVVDHLENNAFLMKYAPERLKAFLKQDLGATHPSVDALFDTARQRRWNQLFEDYHAIDTLFSEFLKTQIILANSVKMKEKDRLIMVNSGYQALSRGDLTAFEEIRRRSLESVYNLDKKDLNPVEHITHKLALTAWRLLPPAHLMAPGALSYDYLSSLARRIAKRLDPLNSKALTAWVKTGVISEGLYTQLKSEGLVSEDLLESLAIFLIKKLQRKENNEDTVDFRIRRPALSALSALMTAEPADFMDLATGTDLIGKSIGKVSKSGVIFFSPVPGRGWNWFVGESLSGFRGTVSGQDIVDGRFKFTVRFSKTGEWDVESVFWMSPAAPLRALGDINVIDITREMADKDHGRPRKYLALTDVSKLMTTDPAQFIELANKTDMEGKAIGRVERNGRITLEPIPNYRWGWVISRRLAGFIGTVVEQGVQNDQFWFLVRFSKADEKDVEQKFYMSPAWPRRRLRGVRSMKGRTMDVLDILPAHAAREKINQVSQGARLSASPPPSGEVLQKLNNMAMENALRASSNAFQRWRSWRRHYRGHKTVLEELQQAQSELTRAWQKSSQARELLRRLPPAARTRTLLKRINRLEYRVFIEELYLRARPVAIYAGKGDEEAVTRVEKAAARYLELLGGKKNTKAVRLYESVSGRGAPIDLSGARLAKVLGALREEPGVVILEGGKEGGPTSDDLEEIAVVDDDGNPAGKAKKTEAHRLGLKHQTAHVYISDPMGRLLLQERSASKSSSPGKLQVPSSGHVNAGESVLDAAIRETYEELGLRIDPARLKGVSTENEIYRSYAAEEGQNSEFTTVYFYSVTTEELQKIKRSYNLHEVRRFYAVPSDVFERLIHERPEIFSRSLHHITETRPDLYQKIKSYAAGARLANIPPENASPLWLPKFQLMLVGLATAFQLSTAQAMPVQLEPDRPSVVFDVVKHGREVTAVSSETGEITVSLNDRKAQAVKQNNTLSEHDAAVKSKIITVLSELEEANLVSDRPIAVLVDVRMFTIGAESFETYGRLAIEEIKALKKRPIMKRVYFELRGPQSTVEKVKGLEGSTEAFQDTPREEVADAVTVYLFNPEEGQTVPTMRNVPVAKVKDGDIAAFQATFAVAGITGKVEASDPHYQSAIESLSGTRPTTEDIQELWNGKAPIEKYRLFSLKPVFEYVDEAIRYALFRIRVLSQSA